MGGPASQLQCGTSVFPKLSENVSLPFKIFFVLEQNLQVRI